MTIKVSDIEKDAVKPYISPPRKKTGFADAVNKIIREESAPLIRMATIADKEIDRLQNKLELTQAELERLRSLNRDKCNTAPPAKDGGCIDCRCDKQPQDVQDSFQAGAVTLAQAIAYYRKSGRMIDSAEGFRQMIDQVVAQQDELDRTRAAEAAALAVLNTNCAYGETTDGQFYFETLTKGA